MEETSDGIIEPIIDLRDVNDILVSSRVKVRSAAGEIDLISINNHPSLVRLLRREMGMRNISFPHLIPTCRPPYRNLQRAKLRQVRP